MSRCLVTGHKGYIGNRIYAQLKKEGHEVMGIDLREEYPKDINKVLAEGDDGKFHPHYFNFKPEFIFHAACFPRVGLGIEQPVNTMKNNVLAGSVVLNFARKVGSVKKLVYSSSSSIAGNGSGPTTPYALQKLTTEMECKIYSEIYGLDTVSLRYFNVYSEDQPADGAYATAVSNWMKCIRQNKRAFITGNGEQRRDMIHVQDVVSANLFFMNTSHKSHGNIYDVGTGNNISLNELKEIIQKYHNIEFDYKPSRLGEVTNTKANIEPLKELGWNFTRTIRRGMDDCFRSIKK